MLQLLAQHFPAYTVATLERMIEAAKPFPLDYSYPPTVDISGDCVTAYFREEYEDGEDVMYYQQFHVAADGYVTNTTPESLTAEETQEQVLLDAIDTAIKMYLDHVGDTVDNREFMIENITALIEHLD